MARISWPSAENSELIEVEFVEPTGATRPLKLLVDSGFTGKSSFVLGEQADVLVRAEYDSAEVCAIRGVHNRVWVKCQLPTIGFEASLIAIITDLDSLSLPDGVNGLAGLSFLRQFQGWGAERSNDGEWRFSLVSAD